MAKYPENLKRKEDLEDQIRQLREQFRSGRSRSAESRYARGKALKHLRKRAGMTADELVRRLAVSTQGRMDYTASSVYAWEKGRNLLQEHIVDQLVPILECARDDLLADDHLFHLDFPASHIAPPTADEIREKGWKAFDGYSYSPWEAEALFEHAHIDWDKVYDNPNPGGGVSSWYYD